MNVFNQYVKNLMGVVLGKKCFDTEPKVFRFLHLEFAALILSTGIVSK
jgi:hypothetical protein